ALTLGANVDAGTGMVTLNSGAAGMQSGGAIIGSQLRLLGAGPYTLNSATNHVNTLAASVSSAVSYTNAGNLTVGTVGGVTGINAGNVTVTAVGNLLVSNNVSPGEVGTVSLTAAGVDSMLMN